MLAALVCACSREHEGARDQRSAADAGDSRLHELDAGAIDAGDDASDTEPLPREPGAAYELCGYPVACREGLQPVPFGPVCVCSGRCEDDHRREENAPGCPAAEDGATSYCDAFGWCSRVCSRYGESDECPAGLACGLTYDGFRCVTTKEILARHREPQPAHTIGPFELYGPCETFSERECPYHDLNTQITLRRADECLCSAFCQKDEHCPAPPLGYGRAVCLLEPNWPRSHGYCSISCDPARGDGCPASLRCQAGPDPSCKASFYFAPPVGLAACRGGLYRHGDGDEVIEPGELYGPRASEPRQCEPGAGTTTAGNGRCVPQSCCTDADCPRPPTSYGTPFCHRWNCYLPCQTDEQCPAGAEYTCQELDFPPPPGPRGCD